ncbi:SGNH/GDSL hydrolase family protein [Coralloluteibacterium thermophilus]|uniref:SGNH/GDSL hydrolase family protein n=1 Tax=Coralloluteibacterium thermophilum TaxID=2707049 RepID=A0ABV9NH93_9GAMM
MSPEAAPRLRYLALGDSYTIGEGVREAGRWPVQLAARLRRHGLPFAAPRIVATTGWTTDELAAGIDAAHAADPLVPPYDLVSLLIGVNNQYRERPLDAYAEEFAALLERALAFAGGRSARVLALSIPDWGATPFGHASGRDLARVARELDAFNAAAGAACRARGVAFVDVTAASRAEPDAVVEDGLHPSAAQYGVWADLALPAVLEAFAQAPRAPAEVAGRD